MVFGVSLHEEHCLSCIDTEELSSLGVRQLRVDPFPST